MKSTYILCAVLMSCLAAAAAYAESPIRDGDRIAIVGNTFADQLRVHGYFETLLLQHTAPAPVTIRNLGWGGDMLTARDRPTNFPSEETTLTAHQADVIIACFGMGESFGGLKTLDQFKSDLRAFVSSHAGKRYNGKSDVRLVLVSPISYEDLGHLTPECQQRNQELAAYTQAMREVAMERKIPFVDLFESSRYLMQETAGPNLTTNGIHLNQFGYWAMSHSFMDQLIVEDQAEDHPIWRLRVDANAESGDATGVQISNVTTDQDGLRFVVTELSAPRLSPPTEQPLPPQLQFNRDTLFVENLNPGNYKLTVDGQSVALGSAADWSQGIAIDGSPTHGNAETFRQAVNDKNLQFTYSWKALNQVHIVGERARSPSGKSLPQEVIKFNKLAIQRDALLAKGIKLQTRQWHLRRAGK